MSGQRKTKNDGRNFHIARNFIKQKILHSYVPHEYYEAAHKQVADLFKRTVETGDSDSLLLVGPRGSGKSNLVHTVIKELLEEPSFTGAALMVELNGFIHSDERLSLKDITRQLHAESLVGNREFRSAADNLSFLLESLKSGNKRSKSVIFVIDEFDLFCNRENQSLIYSLFDVAQAAHTPLCLLGITSYYHVLDLLEERVKSRFSRRQLLLHGAGGPDGLKSRYRHLQQLLYLPQRLCLLDIQSSFLEQWNSNLAKICEDRRVQDIIFQQHQTDTSDSYFRNFLFQVISRLSVEKPMLQVSDFVEIYEKNMEDSKMNMLNGLSVLELCLVIAMKHFTEIYNGEPFNFELILRSYLRFVRQNSSILVTQRSVILKAFQHLKVMEFIKLLEGEDEEEYNELSIGRQKQDEFKMYRLMITDDQIDAAIRAYPNLPTEVSQWACSSLQ
ncbi:origin recognition complex subunit 4 isoform X1 [Schistocerca piceifrons]|uniref:origin recognition complex subunit 4 isoform X1 n=1 Tax=Schistocerca piceifrons TaxID=274613 RepID=UPI001F5F2A2E|nr:origin recognition complex subunit 4 isoform X1 [Schistocerca piceifrons]